MCDGMCEALTSDHLVTFVFLWEGRGSRHLQTYEHRGHYESKLRTEDRRSLFRPGSTAEYMFGDNFGSCLQLTSLSLIHWISASSWHLALGDIHNFVFRSYSAPDPFSTCGPRTPQCGPMGFRIMVIN